MDVDNNRVAFILPELIEWLKKDELVGTLIRMIISWLEVGTKINPAIFASVREALRDAPISIECERPKSEAELSTLWSTIKLEAADRPHAEAEFILEMWVSSLHTRERSQEDEEHAKLLNEAFVGEFHGDNIELFCTTMKRYQSTYDPEKHYGRIVAWHGPSGAGKSKGIDALGQRVREDVYCWLYLISVKYPTFSVCFRSSDDPSEGWPPGDLPAYRFFTSSVGKATEEERVAAFLGAFLEAACPIVAGVDPVRSARDSWRYVHEAGVPYEKSTRGTQFAHVAQRAQELLEHHHNKMEVDTPQAAPDADVPHIETHSTEPEYRYRLLWKLFCEEPASKLMKNLSKPDFCFIAFDECTDIPSLEPISLRRILEAGNHIQNLWFILLGTNAKIQSLQPSVLIVKPSARFAKLSCLPAWCHFGFGQLAPPEPETPRSALYVDYLRRIGRPLFATYRTSTVTYRTASKKLFSPAQEFSPHNITHIFTAFSHRILLSLGNTDTAHQMAAESVHSNLRYARSIDGNIVRTVCPSEPLLSLISTDVLNKGSNFAMSLKTLVAAVKKSTIDRGEEGELYCRLLLMRARDVACQNNLPSSLSDKLFGNKGGSEFVGADLSPEDTFSQASFQVRLITLESHLDALVHLRSVDSAQADKLRNYIRTYHINITHTIRLASPITAIPQEYLKKLFIRGVMVQCAHSQPVIDGFYVAYGGDLDKPFDLDRFLIVSWQSKAKTAAASQAELVASLTGPMQVKPNGKRCKTHQVVLLMDLNTKAAFKGSRSNPVDPFLQVSFRRATVPTYAPPKKANQTPTKAWGGYATAADEKEPETWCVNIRGHDGVSYRCAMATENEPENPDFSSLFDEVGSDMAASSILGPVVSVIDASLHPLQTF